MGLKYYKRILLSEEEKKGDDPSNLALKISSIFIFLGMAIGFGLMPYYIKKCRTSTKFLSISNAFSGGLFLGIGLFHVLPEGAEKLADFELPWAYFCAYLSYALILFVEKVAFNGHALLHGHGNTPYKQKAEVMPIGGLNSGRDSMEQVDEDKLIQKEIEYDQEHEHDEEDEGIHVHMHDHGSKLGITPYILLLALGFHGFFEGMALGIQGELRDSLFLALAIAAHKWAASLTLGISIIKSGIQIKQLIIMILIFGFIGPVGIALGMIIRATASEIVEGIFLAISVGTFLYIACSEVLVEEFEHSDYKYFKFCAFLFGGFFTAGLSLIEYYSGVEG